jgi:hypothetical protein
MGPSCVHYWDRFVPAIRSDLDEQWVPLVDRNVPVAVRISTNNGSLSGQLLGSFRPGSFDPLGTNLRKFENHCNYK